MLNIYSVVGKASVEGCLGMQKCVCVCAPRAKCPFFLISLYACLFRCASRHIFFVEHTDPLYMLNTYIISTSTVRCSLRNVFAMDQYTGFRYQSKPSSRHQLQGASGCTSHGRTPSPLLKFSRTCQGHT